MPADGSFPGLTLPGDLFSFIQTRQAIHNASFSFSRGMELLHLSWHNNYVVNYVVKYVINYAHPVHCVGVASDI